MARCGGRAATLQWRFQFEEVADVCDLGLWDGITAVRRMVTVADVFLRSAYHRSCLPPEQYYTLVLMEWDDKYIYAIDCNGIETNGRLQALEVVVHDTSGDRHPVCYVRFRCNCKFKVFKGKFPGC